MKRLKYILLALAALLPLVTSCDSEKRFKPEDNSYSEVMILYSEGYNSLSSYLKEDIEDLQTGWVPAKKADKAIVIISSLPASKADYMTPTAPVMIWLHKEKNLNVMDTLKTYPGAMLADAATMRRILQDVQKSFSSEHYGLVVSSHATGWVPEGYYSHPERFEGSSNESGWFKPRMGWNGHRPGLVPEEEEFPGAPMVKSFGSTNRVEDGKTVSYEIEISDLASKAIPFHLDYLIIDACLMGGIEVAYELKDVADLIAFSQTEVMAEGLDYKSLAARLLENDEPDVIGVADDYYTQYEKKTGINQSATISVVDCRKLEPLATLCRTLFSRYRDGIAAVNPESVQRYFRSFHHWYYDLEDIMIKAGINDPDLRQLKETIDSCLPYKNATSHFMGSTVFGGFSIDVFSGLSMYLPANGSRFLDSFYKGLAWNKATELVD